MIRASNRFPISVGQCRCGKGRGHTDLCNGEVEQPTVKKKRQKKLSGTPFHYMRDDLVGQFGEEMGYWIACRIATHVRNKECLSDFSIAELPTGSRVLSPTLWKELGRHTEVRSGGCCGSFDAELHHYTSGRKFTFGFNYGH